MPTKAAKRAAKAMIAEIWFSNQVTKAANLIDRETGLPELIAAAKALQNQVGGFLGCCSEGELSGSYSWMAKAQDDLRAALAKVEGGK